MVFQAGYWGLFASGFIAATVIPMSSEGVLLIMLSSGYDPFSCLLIASISNWLGGMTSYGLGHIGKEKWLRKVTGVKKTSIEKTRHFIDRYKAPMALICWLPIIGDVIAVALGFFKINFIAVSLYMLIGKTLRYAFLVYIFYLY